MHPPAGPPPAPVLPDSRRNAAEAVTWPVRVAAAWGWRLLVAAAVIYALVQILSRVGLVVFPVIIALFLTAILQPLERQLRRVAPRPASLATLLAVLCGVIVLGGIGYFVAWQISTHITQLGNEIADVVTHTRRWLQTGPLHVKSSDLDKLSSKLTQAVKSHEGALVSGAISTVRGHREPGRAAADLAGSRSSCCVTGRSCGAGWSGFSRVRRMPASTTRAGPAGARSAVTCAASC